MLCYIFNDGKHCMMSEAIATPFFAEHPERITCSFIRPGLHAKLSYDSGVGCHVWKCAICAVPAARPILLIGGHLQEDAL